VVGYALLASLGAAFLVVPALGARILGDRPPARRLPFDDEFTRLVRSFTRHRGLVAFGGILAALLAVPIFWQVGADFLPGADAGELGVRLDLSEGSPIERTAAVSATVERKLAELAGDDLEALYTEVGEVEEDLWLRTEEVSSEGTAEIHAVLRPRPGRPSARALAGAIEPFLETVPDAAYAFRFGETDLEKTVGTGGEVLEIEVRGENLGEIQALSEAVAGMAEQLGPERVLHVTTSFREGREEVRLIPDRTILSALGMDLEGLASSVRRRLEGEEAGTFRPGSWDRKIALRYPDRPLQELLELPIDNPAGVEVRLRDLIRVERGRAPREIHRRGQSRAAVVRATLVPGADFAGTARALESGLEGIHVPTGVRLLVAGEEKERRASFRELQWALLLALALVFMVLASLFESLVHPFTILLTVPLSAVGVALAFYFWGEPITVPALIGAVLVAGIAVNDAVILVDYATRLRRQGVERTEAVVRAARVRLRPILMTSLTTVAALLPMALGFGEGGSLRSPLAVAVIGGLTASTVLTLLVVPAVYLLLDNLRPQRVREEHAPAAG
jgi:HAE1 family hydrophobic/amphiphilic exporter-1